MATDLDPHHIVTRVLSSPSPRAEAALRRALAAHFSNAETEEIVSSVIAGRNCTSDGTPIPGGLRRFAYHLQPYEHRHARDDDSVTFWPDDFFAFFLDLATATGINIQQFARGVGDRASSDEQSVARALITVAEVEGVYVENPGALTEMRVPRQFLFIMAAALIGMASGDRRTVNGAVVGALSGVGALAIELLADRYMSDPEPHTDFLENLVLELLEKHGPMSSRELRAETHIEAQLLRSIIKRLLSKRLIRRILTYTNSRLYRYDLAER